MPQWKHAITKPPLVMSNDDPSITNRSSLHHQHPLIVSRARGRGSLQLRRKVMGTPKRGRGEIQNYVAGLCPVQKPGHPCGRFSCPTHQLDSVHRSVFTLSSEMVPGSVEITIRGLPTTPLLHIPPTQGQTDGSLSPAKYCPYACLPAWMMSR